MPGWWQEAWKGQGRNISNSRAQGRRLPAAARPCEGLGASQRVLRPPGTRVASGIESPRKPTMVPLQVGDAGRSLPGVRGQRAAPGLLHLVHVHHDPHHPSPTVHPAGPQPESRIGSQATAGRQPAAAAHHAARRVQLQAGRCLRRVLLLALDQAGLPAVGCQGHQLGEALGCATVVST